jgi:short-chain fatty acids transporter
MPMMRAPSSSVAEEAESLCAGWSQPLRPAEQRLPGCRRSGGLAGLWVRGVALPSTRGFDLDLNIMIFTFFVIGLAVHRTPMRYGIAMKRACANVYGHHLPVPVLCRHHGHHDVLRSRHAQISLWLADGASMATLPLIAQFAGAVVNFAIPSAGGEWAVIGPALTETALASRPICRRKQQAFVARIAMAVAYGETSTNLLQPFFLLTVLPVMGAGVLVQARDVMGYLVLPFVLVYLSTALLLAFLPM